MRDGRMLDFAGVEHGSGLVGFLVATKLLAHGREQFFCKSVILARAKTGVQRGRQHIGRHRFLNGCLNGPAALA